MASPAVLEQMLREIDERVDNLQKKYREKLLSRGISGKFRSVTGKAGEKIIAVSKEEQAGLIVTGTRGQGKIKRTIMGSVSTYVIHHATVPVLVCRWKNKDKD